MTHRSTLTAALALAVVLLGCAPGTSPSPAAGTLNVVTTTTVFADFVRQVGGAHVNVTSLVPKDSDVHTFAPKPSDATAIADADLVVMNGLGLDDWLERLVTNASTTDVPIVKLGEDVPGVEYIQADEDEGGGDNPHLWMDPKYARLYVDLLRIELDDLDPANQADYDAAASAYAAKLTDLDAYIRAQFDTIPAADRKLVSFHDAFPYYARAYGLDIVGVVVSAPGQDPSAGEVADLIDAIKASGVKLILAEVQFPDRLVQQIAAESGASVESKLYDDALGDAPVDTYEGMMRWDTDKIVAGLR